MATLERLTGGAPAQAPLVLMAYQVRRAAACSLRARLLPPAVDGRGSSDALTAVRATPRQSRSRQTDAALFARLARRFTVAEDAEGARRSALVSDKVRLYQLRRRAAAGV